MSIISLISKMRDEAIRKPQPKGPSIAVNSKQSQYQPIKGGAMVYGASVPDYPGLAEDSFSFPNGGNYSRTPSRINLNGAFVPGNLGLQEDSFEFNPQQMVSGPQVQGGRGRTFQQGTPWQNANQVQGSGMPNRVQKQIQPAIGDIDESWIQDLLSNRRLR